MMCPFTSLSVCSQSHGRISWSIFAKSGTEVTTPKSMNEFVVSTSPQHFSYFLPPQNRHFGLKGPENSCKHKHDNLCLKCSRIARIPASYKKLGAEKHDSDVRFQTGSRNEPGSHMRIEKYAILECGPMPNVMVALPNIGGALCSTPQSLDDAHY